MSAQDNLGAQFVMYHGTNEAAADNILANGANSGTWVGSARTANSYREIADEHRPSGGVTVEGYLDGPGHRVSGQHMWGGGEPAPESATWQGNTAPNNDTPSIAFTQKHGAFVPTRLHYSDGEKVDL